MYYIPTFFVNEMKGCLVQPPIWSKIPLWKNSYYPAFSWIAPVTGSSLLVIIHSIVDVIIMFFKLSCWILTTSNFNLLFLIPPPKIAHRKHLFSLCYSISKTLKKKKKNICLIHCVVRKFKNYRACQCWRFSNQT